MECKKPFCTALERACCSKDRGCRNTFKYSLEPTCVNGKRQRRSGVTHRSLVVPLSTPHVDRHARCTVALQGAQLCGGVLVCIGASVGMAKANSVARRGLFGREAEGISEASIPIRMRWRVRGWDGWQTYGRIEWESEDQRAFFCTSGMQESAGLISILCTIPVAQNGVKSPWEMSDPRPEEDALGRGRHGMPTGRWSLRESRDLGYRSTGENGIIRGVAWRHQVAGWKWMIAGGRAHFDARLGPEGYVVSLPKSGLHRTSTEREGRRLLYAEMPVEAALNDGVQWVNLACRFSMRSFHVGST